VTTAAPASSVRAPAVTAVIAFALPVILVITAHAAASSDIAAFPVFLRLMVGHAAIYVLVVAAVLIGRASAPDLALILISAVLFRAIAMTVPDGILTNDAYRYVWDGRIQWAGFNPYLWVPADPQLAPLRDLAIYPEIYLKEIAVTVYPPMAQMLFALANAVADSLDGIRVLMLVSEAVIIWAVLAWLKAARMPLERIVIYAWHPIPIWEFAGHLHLDAAAIALMLLGIVAVVHRRQGLAGCVLAAAVATKYFPLVILPALWRRWDWRMPVAFIAVLIGLYLPYVAGAGLRVFGFFGGYLDNEGYASGYGFHLIWVLRDFALADPSPRLYLALVLSGLMGLALVALFRRAPDAVEPAHLIALTAAFVWATSPHYAWYFAVLIPLLCRHLSPAVFAFSIAAVLMMTPGGDAWWNTQTARYVIVFGTLPVALVCEALAPRAARMLSRGQA
jgi:alpha-1,6-mannosyltransferase